MFSATTAFSEAVIRISLQFYGDVTSRSFITHRMSEASFQLVGLVAFGLLHQSITGEHAGRVDE